MSGLFYPKCCTRIGGGAMGARASVPNQLIGHPASRSRFSVNPASCPLSVSPVTCIVWEYSWRSVLCARARAALCGEYSCKRRFRCKYRPPACTLYPWLYARLRAGLWLMPVSDERVDAYRHAYRLPVRVPGSPRVRGRGTLQRFVSTKHDNGNRHAGLAHAPRRGHGLSL